MFFIRFYDTDEAEILGIWEQEVEEYPHITDTHTLYKTKNGEYFIHNDGIGVLCGDEPAIQPMSFDTARNWLKMVNIDKYNKEFGAYEIRDIIFDEYTERMMRNGKN